jgi:hypothetical protein
MITSPQCNTMVYCSSPAWGEAPLGNGSPSRLPHQLPFPVSQKVMMALKDTRRPTLGADVVRFADQQI